jgi:hypothetical protein
MKQISADSMSANGGLCGDKHRHMLEKIVGGG